jgi:hypothetical protein
MLVSPLGFFSLDFGVAHAFLHMRRLSLRVGAAFCRVGRVVAARRVGRRYEVLSCRCLCVVWWQTGMFVYPEEFVHWILGLRMRFCMGFD